VPNDAIDYINRDIVNVKTELQNISKIVRDGNGQPSLMQQVATLQNDLAHTEIELREQIVDLQERLRVCNTKHTENNKLGWHFQTAIWVALIGSITSIVVHYMDPKPQSETDRILEHISQRLDQISDTQK